MMRWIIGTSLRARRLVIALAAGVLVLGIAQLRDMPVDVLPEFVPPMVEVQTEALGLSAEEVENFITVPLEQDLLNGIAFLDEIRSASVPGLSSIQMVFEPDTDLLSARQVVQERISQAQVALPGVQSRPPQMLQPLSSTSRVMIVGLSSDQLSAIDESILTRWTIGPKLLGVPGVANVAVWGFRDQQLQILVDPERLRQNGVSLEQVIETSANANIVCPLTFVECSTPGTGGIIETPNQRVGVHFTPVLTTPGALEQVPVEDAEGRRPPTLGDVSDVAVDHQVLIGDSVGPDLLLVVEKFPSANTLDVTRGVEDALDALRPGLSGVDIDTSLYRPAAYIEHSRGNLVAALLLGAALALLLLGAMLFDWRSAVVSVTAIAVSVAAGWAAIALTDATLNAMTAAGFVLALVVIIDGAVSDVENYVRRLRDLRADGDGARVGGVLLGAALETRRAAAYGALIAIVSIVPAFFTKGSFGAFFPSIASSYAIAALASVAVGLIVTPALGYFVFSRAPLRRGESPVVRWLSPRYGAVLQRFVGSPLPALVLTGAVLVAGLASLPLLSRSSGPTFKDTNIVVHVEGIPGTSLPEMQRISARMAEDLRALPDVRAVGAHVGRAVLSDQVVGTNASELWVSVDPGADYGATVAAVEDIVGRYPGLRSDVTTYPAERIGEVLSAPEEPVAVRVYGHDLGVLRSTAENVQRILAGIDGIVDPRVELPAEEPTLEIEVDLGAAEQHGIKPGDVRRAAATLVSGTTVGSLFEEQKVFEVVVWGTPETRNTLSSLNGLLIDTPGGGQVPLGDVADVRIAPAPTAIRHESVSRYLDVVAGASGRDLDAVLADVDAGLEEVDFPLEYHAEVLGGFRERRAADRRAMVLAVAAAIVILLLLQAAVGSWRLAGVLFLMLPAALAGGAIAALIAGGTLSLGSVAGFVALLAIAARQLIASIGRLRRLERGRPEPLGADGVLREARELLPSVLIPASMTVLLFTALLAAGDTAGLEIVRPMAVVVVGGLVSSTLLALLVAPAVYARLGGRPDMEAEVSVERLIDLTKHEETELIGGR